MENAVLFGPFIGEMYWECGRFASMLLFYKQKKYKKQNPKFIILTRPDRFDLYGKSADILVPLRIEGDYEKYQPECFRLLNYPLTEYENFKKSFFDKYNQRYNILEHVVPNITKKQFANKNQYTTKHMIFQYYPREENYDLVDNYLPKNKKPLVILAPRFRKGFNRNWGEWQTFYDVLYNNKELYNMFNFIICGKRGEYIPDKDKRFLDMNDIELSDKSSLIGVLFVLMEKSCFVFGSQSAIPNIALLYKVETLMFGHQKQLHTITYNYYKTPVTFIENKNYNISVSVIFDTFSKIVKKYK